MDHTDNDLLTVIRVGLVAKKVASSSLLISFYEEVLDLINIEMFWPQEIFIY